VQVTGDGCRKFLPFVWVNIVFFIWPKTK